MIRIGYCETCGIEIDVRFCCNSFDCGCMGLPIDPPICSEVCYDKLIEKIHGKTNVYKAGDRVEILKAGDKGTMWIINGRWVNVKLDNGETYKGETDEIKHCTSHTGA